MNTDETNSERKLLIETNLAEFGPKAERLQWVSASRAAEARSERASRLAALEGAATLAHKGTKPHLGPLSPGCRLCGAGEWSCLFINGKCNCGCFYCPTSQDTVGVPTTHRVPFGKASDYADYVRAFGFKGVSISGGEPLLTFDATLRFISAVRRRNPADLHIWMYTSSAPLKRDHLLRLRDAGLNEIRFDISAVGYDIKKLSMAAGLIDCLTVEIPAIPEDIDKLKGLLPVLASAGVKHLNLHQLRLTPHNCDRLAARGYTFLHGEKVTVLESELTALAVLQASAEGAGLPVNYCSFAYKYRYERAAARRRNARHICKPHESITENGYIRTLSLSGRPEEIGRQAEALAACGADRALWMLNAGRDRLICHEGLWPQIDAGCGSASASYYAAQLSAGISYRCAFKEVQLNANKSVFVEKQPAAADIPLDDRRRDLFEEIPAGLQEYF